MLFKRILSAAITGAALLSVIPSVAATTHDELVEFFKEWREFEKPPMIDGVPDYTKETFDKRYAPFKALQERLMAMDTTGWERSEIADWHFIRAEMNGYDFNHRILMPWVRDPAYYKTIWTYRSDVPAHEGPTHHAVLELWDYQFPLSDTAEAKLIRELNIIAPFNEQAKKNLTGNAKELWIAGIRDIRTQSQVLENLYKQVADDASDALKEAIMNAKASTDGLVAWLEAEAPKKTGPSGIGKDNYTWYQQQVHLVPLTWEDEVRLLKRELDRAWSSLKLEEHRNRHLPQLQAASTPEEYNKLAKWAADNFLEFLKEQEIVTVHNIFRPALYAQMGQFIPEEKRNFFRIGQHIDPRPLYSHFYHYFELAIMDTMPNPNPIRRGAALYNIYDSKNEGLATGVEEMFMHAGLYDDTPRAREIVWIMMAQRAARGLGSLYAHANDMTMEEAGNIHMDWTPRGWMKTEKELLIFEQHLYLRQPGYGTSYITGKYLLERLLADYGKIKEEQGEPLVMKDFFDTLNDIGGIPISLGRYEMTGLTDELEMIGLQ